MQLLEPPDLHFLAAASGWLGLGNAAEAKSELARIKPELQNHPDVLEIRWCVCAEDQQWEEALNVARTLLERAPDRSSGWLHQAYALRRVSDGGLKRAWDALLPAFDKFPAEPTICYNLSCYACQLDQLEAARVWFKRAIVIGGKQRAAQIKEMALADS